MYNEIDKFKIVGGEIIETMIGEELDCMNSNGYSEITDIIIIDLTSVCNITVPLQKKLYIEIILYFIYIDDLSEIKSIYDAYIKEHYLYPELKEMYGEIILTFNKVKTILKTQGEPLLFVGWLRVNSDACSACFIEHYEEGVQWSKLTD